MEQSQAPHWKVISVQDTNVRNEQGMSEPGKRVNIQFVDGNHSMVELPARPGWSDHAQELISALADEHAKVMAMEGPPVTVTSKPRGFR